MRLIPIDEDEASWTNLSLKAAMRGLEDDDIGGYSRADLKIESQYVTQLLASEQIAIGSKPAVAVLAMFYGIIVSMYYFDRRRHHVPHIHVKYQDQEAVIAIPEGDVLEGELRSAKLKLVLAWVEIHRDELMADWELATQGEAVFKIDPLK